MRPIFILLLIASLAGCASPSQETLEPSGSDKLPLSACAKCDDKVIFYKNGQWLGERS